MLYFKTIGFFSPNREKGSAFESVAKIEWKTQETDGEDTDREFAVLEVQQLVQVGNELMPLQGESNAHYVWRFKGRATSYPKGVKFAEKEYKPEHAPSMEAVADEQPA